jgi:hypothetical protein
MATFQPDQQEDQLTSRLIAPLNAPTDVLELPRHKPRKHGGMSIILWTLLLALGVLIFLVRTPLHAPPFDSLTQYVCDPPPRLPLQANRLGTYPLEFKCQAGDQVLYQRQAVINNSNPSGLKACRKEGGLIRIWRMPPPSAYGAYVFHSTCGDHTLMYYKHRAAAYESSQRFTIGVAGLMIVASLAGLSFHLLCIAKINSISD